jgi:hypothetical protein
MSFAALALAALAAAGANPQTLPQNPPAVFSDYSHPEVSAEACRSTQPDQTVCFLPPKTMGRYVITAVGTSTPTSPDATQAIVIAGPGWVCGQPAATKKGEWTAEGPRSLVARCVITVLSDDPVKIVVSFGGADAKLSADGPKVTLQPVPWTGVLEASDFQIGVAAPKPAK